MKKSFNSVGNPFGQPAGKRPPLTDASPRRHWKTVWMAMIATALAVAFEPGRVMAQRPLGIDVSSYQGQPNWGSAHGGGVVFAYAKATEGTTITDSDFVYNQNNGKAAGVYMGAYHFAHPNSASPGAEAGHFWAVAGPYIKADGKTLMPTLDFEVFSGVAGASSYSDWANQWCNDIAGDAFAQGVRIKPVIYTSACSACNFNSSVAQWNCWIADYNSQNLYTGTPWSTCTGCEVWGGGVWDMWQVSSSGAIPGISGSVDLDTFNGNSAGLVATLVPSASLNTKPVVVVPPSGDMSVFAIYPDGSVWTTWQNSPRGPWSGWASLGGVGATQIDAVPVGAGQISLFSCGGGAVWTRWQDQVGGYWNDWISLGGNGFTHVKALVFSDGHMALVGCGNGTPIYWNYQASPGGAWSGWINIGGGGNTYVDAVVAPDQTVSIFSCGGGAAWTDWQNVPNPTTGTWSSASLGGNGFTKLKALTFADGHLALVACGNGTDIQYNSQLVQGGPWSGFVSLGGAGFQQIDAVVTANQAVSVFGCGGQAVYTIWQNQEFGSWSSYWAFPGSGFQNQTATVLNDGSMALFGGASETPVWYEVQSYQYGPWQSSWANLGGTLE